jgi:hypothetical protein
VLGIFEIRSHKLLFRLSLNCDLPDLYLQSSEDYRRESLDGYHLVPPFPAVIIGFKST